MVRRIELARDTIVSAQKTQHSLRGSVVFFLVLNLVLQSKLSFQRFHVLEQQ